MHHFAITHQRYIYIYINLSDLNELSSIKINSLWNVWNDVIMRLVTKIFSNMLVFSRAKMRLVVSQPKKRKNYEIGYLKKLIWYGKI